MKRCERCGKPLIEFEEKFHQRAESPASISEKCWICSGAELQFEGGYADKPHHLVEISVCLIGIVLLILLSLPVLPFLHEYEVPVFIQIYMYALVGVYIIITTAITIIIHCMWGKKPKVGRVDPPLQRFYESSGPNTDIYTTTVNRDGNFVTTKETRYGYSKEDMWSTSDASDAPFSKVLWLIWAVPMYIIIHMLIGGFFVMWVGPYILVMIVRDIIAYSHNQEIPARVRRVYRFCRKYYGESPLTYGDKAAFLIAREKHFAKKARSKNGFASQFAQETDHGAPFYYIHKKGVSYMIVDYVEGERKSYFTTFVLVKKKNEDVKKRMIVGNGFVPSLYGDTEADWIEAGISEYALQHLEWYERKMDKILRSPKKFGKVVG